MALSGAGAGIGELTSLAVASELAPTRKRGKYVSVLVFTIIPFCPSVLWAQLIASHGGWRYCGVLVPLLLGAAFIMAFCVWEAKGAKFPMFPSRLLREPRILTLTLIITFISGANFFSVIMFWPTQAFNVYGHDATQVGIRGLPIG